MNRYGKRDANETALLTCVEPLGGLWIPSGPFDGWLWNRHEWHLCEVKAPCKQGWRSEFTEVQRRLILRLNERQVPFHVLRTEGDVLALVGARQSA
jgi:hypothetical protein